MRTAVSPFWIASWRTVVRPAAAAAGMSSKPITETSSISLQVRIASIAASAMRSLIVVTATRRCFPKRGRRSEEHTSELQSPCNLVCRLLLEKKKKGITAFPEKKVSDNGGIKDSNGQKQVR